MTGKNKRFNEADQDAMMSELSGSAFFQQSTSTQGDKTTSTQKDKKVKPQVDKYTTHLRPDTIKAIKTYALDHDMKDYELAQHVFDRFFEEANKE